jgi:hypothetical protein
VQDAGGVQLIVRSVFECQQGVVGAGHSLQDLVELAVDGRLLTCLGVAGGTLVNRGQQPAPQRPPRSSSSAIPYSYCLSCLYCLERVPPHLMDPLIQSGNPRSMRASIRRLTASSGQSSSDQQEHVPPFTPVIRY